MARRTAIIDIGSNSLTLVVYEKSSRFAFHLIEKSRSRVRIGEGAYENGGYLQEIAMERAYDSISDFLSIARSLRCRKVLCVATSALRDAPNKKVFLKRVERELKLNIRVIDGDREAWYGALAAATLLPLMTRAVTIDIGGGSTELALIEEGEIKETLSLDIGTVRIKELFFDKKCSFEEAERFILEVCASIPSYFASGTVVGIGGTIRALSTTIMHQENYPLNSLHAYTYKVGDHRKFIKKVARSELLKLKTLGISKSRFDTIREGSAIFSILLERLEARDVIVSKAGVREGVYLHDILRNANYRFPRNFNPSIKSLIDRFAMDPRNNAFLGRTAASIFDVLQPAFGFDSTFRNELLMAAKLIEIGKRISIYSNNSLSFDFMLENLNFALSHKQKILIALLVRYAQKREINEKEITPYRALLPKMRDLRWYGFIMSLTACLNASRKIQKIEVAYHKEEKSLYLRGTSNLFLAKECSKKLSKPSAFAIIVEER
ncbi:MAG: hypothetical protein B6D59_02245 [Campylobacteraceae bacterium 4484_4]|nr:MAG: hypothetical protein B6D59_02245 [Campylobacteraceae bacterium 4484_4]